MVVPFQKGVGQKFRQPSGTGIDLGFFELDDLSKPSPAEDVFPLVISAETCSPPDSVDHIGEPVLDASPHMQITQSVLEKNNDDPFQVKVIKQILWIDEVRYELREIYGIATSAVGFDDNDPGKECVICMTEPKDTAVLPCRHMVRILFEFPFNGFRNWILTEILLNFPFNGFRNWILTEIFSCLVILEPCIA